MRIHQGINSTIHDSRFAIAVMEASQSSVGLGDSSYQDISPPAAYDSDDMDSLPSTSATSTEVSPSEAEAYSDAEREWNESLQQLELLLTMVLVPYLGRYFGRKAAYWGKGTRQAERSLSLIHI